MSARYRAVEFSALIVDDEATYSASLQRLLARRGVRADVAGTATEALAQVRRHAYDLVVLDQVLPDGNGIDLIPPVRALGRPPRVLMMTAYGTVDDAVEAMRRGAWDYVTKSTHIDRVVDLILETRRVAEARGAGEAPASASELIGESPGMVALRRRIGEVARSTGTTVLLGGESGTGKGVAARAIHAASACAGEPFVAVDCIGLPPTLAESELFGHERGAFTGADRARVGRLEQAGAGTVLLDEIGDMDPLLQGKLLRVLEERSFDRVGGGKPVAMRARVVAASHRDLPRLVEEGRFRLDLFHRLSVFPLRLPALRDRGDDVALLAEHFRAEFARRLERRIAPLSHEVLDALRGHDFPGNVRELRNVIERAAILASDGTVTPALLPDRITDPARGASVAPMAQERSGALAAGDADGERGGIRLEFRPGTDTIEGIEQRLIEETLRRCGGKRARAAELLGLSRFALNRRLARYRT